MILGARTAMWGGGKKTPTARDYVQDGLTFLLDGIENVGWDTNNQSAQYWIDLIGNKQISVNGNTWGADYLNVNGRYHRVTINNFSTLAQSAATYEFVAKLNSAQSGQWGRMFNSRYGDSRIFGIYSGKDSTTFARFEVLYGSYVAVDTPTTNLLVRHSFSMAYGSSNGIAYVDGDSGSINPNIGNLGNFAIASAAQIGAQANGQTWANLDCCALRVYNRALTAAEIDANHAVDVERFNLPA